MFVSKIAQEPASWVRAWTEDSIRPVIETPVCLVQPTSRGEHARMLAIAAARRLRAVERAGLQRSEDAGYWKAVAPVAIRKAAGLRGDQSFRRLPG